ncbi:MAG: hypothetical protein LBB93_05715, partial [Elusimicrobiota bacterium]|nr:hypothetical protein [Elusimicrobiota bacterium]
GKYNFYTDDFASENNSAEGKEFLLGDNLVIVNEIAINQAAPLNFTAQVLKSNTYKFSADSREVYVTGLLYSYIMKVNSDATKVDVELVPISDDLFYLADTRTGNKSFRLKENVFLYDERWAEDTLVNGNLNVWGEDLTIYAVKPKSNVRSSLFYLTGTANNKVSISLNNVAISSAYTSGSGSAVKAVIAEANGEPTVSVSNTQFSNNEAAVSGGAVFVNGADFNAQATNGKTMSFFSNKANNGGAFYSQNDLASLFVPTFYSKGAGSLLIFSNNLASENGGAMYIAPGSKATIKTESGGRVVFSNNEAAQNGGAIFLAGSLEIIADGNSMLFSDNFSIRDGMKVKNDIHIADTGEMVLNGKAGGELRVNSISGDGTINNKGTQHFILTGANDNFVGLYNQEGSAGFRGTTTFMPGSQVFEGKKQISHGTLEVYNSTIPTQIHLANSGNFVFYSMGADEKKINGQIGKVDGVISGATATFTKAPEIASKPMLSKAIATNLSKYLLAQDIPTGVDFVFVNSYVRFARDQYAGNVNFENSSIDIRATVPDDKTLRTARTITIDKISFIGQDNALLMGIYFDGMETSETPTINYDKIYSQAHGSGFINNLDIDWRKFDSYKVRGDKKITLKDIFKNISFASSAVSTYKAKYYTFTLNVSPTDNSAAILTVINDVPDKLYISNSSTTTRAFSVAIGEYWNLREDLSETAWGSFYVGYNKFRMGGTLSGIIDEEFGGGAASLFKLINDNTQLDIEKISISNAYADTEGAIVATKYSSGSVVFMTNALSGAAFLDATIENNFSAFGGGAVFAQAGTLKIRTGRFYNNVSSKGLGGAIYVGENANFSLSGNVIFKGNTDVEGPNDIYAAGKNNIVSVSPGAYVELDGGIKGEVLVDVHGILKGPLNVGALNIRKDGAYELNNGVSSMTSHIEGNVDIDGTLVIAIYKDGNNTVSDVLEVGGADLSAATSALNIHSYGVGSAQGIVIMVSTSPILSQFSRITDSNNYQGASFNDSQSAISGGWGKYSFSQIQKDGLYYGLLNINVSGEPLLLIAKTQNQTQAAQAIQGKPLAEDFMFMSPAGAASVCRALESLSGQFLAQTIVSAALSDNGELLYEQADAGAPVTTLSNSVWGNHSYEKITLTNDKNAASKLSNDAQYFSAGYPVFSAAEIGMAGVFIKGGKKSMKSGSDKAQNMELEVGVYGAWYKPLPKVDNIKFNISAGYDTFSTQRYFKIYQTQYYNNADFNGGLLKGGVQAEFKLTDFAPVDIPVEIKPYIALNGALLLTEKFTEKDNNAVSLSVADNQYERVSGIVGVKIEKNIDTVHIYAKAGIENMFIGNDEQVTMSLANSGGQTMKIRGIEIDSTMLFSGSVGSTLIIANNVLAFGAANIKQSSNLDVFGVNIGLAYSFGSNDKQARKIKEMRRKREREAREKAELKRKIEEERRREEQEKIERARREAEAKEAARIAEERKFAKAQAQAAALAMLQRYSASAKTENVDLVKPETTVAGGIEIVKYNDTAINPRLLEGTTATKYTNTDWIMLRVQVELEGKFLWITPVKISAKAYAANSSKLNKKDMDIIIERINKLMSFKVIKIRVLKYTVNKKPNLKDDTLADIRAKALAAELDKIGFVTTRERQGSGN